MTKPMPNFTRKYITRFLSRVAKGAPNECWDWQGWTFGNGYGGFKAFNKCWLAHRVAYYLHHNEDPGDLCVCHTCDDPKCCNPYHLWLGTKADNSADMVTKGRRYRKDERGGGNPAAKLTNKKVKRIRKLYTTGKYTLTQLAKKYAVSTMAVHYVVTRKPWAHI